MSAQVRWLSGDFVSWSIFMSVMVINFVLQVPIDESELWITSLQLAQDAGCSKVVTTGCTHMMKMNHLTWESQEMNAITDMYEIYVDSFCKQRHIHLLTHTYTLRACSYYPSGWVEHSEQISLSSFIWILLQSSPTSHAGRQAHFSSH